MARRKREKEDIKKKVKKVSDNLKQGKFTRDELLLYSLKDKEIDTILEYQKILPVLSENTRNWIEGRILHSQLQVKTLFSLWIKRKIDKYGFVKNEDYISVFNFENAQFTQEEVENMSENKRSAYGITEEYRLELDMAKQLAMLENNEIGQVARKYFIYIEKAFKNRLEWNRDRQSTLDNFKNLNRALYKVGDKLSNTPDYCWNNQMGESCLLNEIIIGMSAKRYKELNGLPKDAIIRNTFNERQLELYHLLEQYDADLMEIQEEYDYEERRKYLTKKLNIELGYYNY